MYQVTSDDKSSCTVLNCSKTIPLSYVQSWWNGRWHSGDKIHVPGKIREHLTNNPRLYALDEIHWGITNAGRCQILALNTASFGILEIRTLIVSSIHIILVKIVVFSRGDNKTYHLLGKLSNYEESTCNGLRSIFITLGLFSSTQTMLYTRT